MTDSYIPWYVIAMVCGAHVVAGVLLYLAKSPWWLWVLWLLLFPRPAVEDPPALAAADAKEATIKHL